MPCPGEVPSWRAQNPCVLGEAPGRPWVDVPKPGSGGAPRTRVSGKAGFPVCPMHAMPAFSPAHKRDAGHSVVRAPKQPHCPEPFTVRHNDEMLSGQIPVGSEETGFAAATAARAGPAPGGKGNFIAAMAFAWRLARAEAGDWAAFIAQWPQLDWVWLTLFDATETMDPFGCCTLPMTSLSRKNSTACQAARLVPLSSCSSQRAASEFG
jgi:hypothetical protein